MKHFKGTFFVALTITSILFSSCGPAPTATEAVPAPTEAAPAATEAAPDALPAEATAGPFTLTSSAFAEGAEIPVKYTYILGGQCSGENISPPLSWTGDPAGTQSLALTMIDPDGGNWVHWVQFDIPADATELPEAVGGPEIGVKGLNHFGESGYGGPCPPGGVHHYVFTLYALDSVLSLSPGTTHVQLTLAMQGHILAESQLIGTRSP